VSRLPYYRHPGIAPLPLIPAAGALSRGFAVQMQQPCDQCRGKGVTFKQRCPDCGGGGIVEDNKALTCIVDAGMKDGDELKFDNEASVERPDVLPGDLIFVLRVDQKRSKCAAGLSLSCPLN
jgi:molecular chaperone DnaJ